MEMAKIYEDLTKMGVRVAYVENVNNTIVLKDTHTDEEIAMIEEYLRKYGLRYQIINPQPVESETV